MKHVILNILIVLLIISGIALFIESVIFPFLIWTAKRNKAKVSFICGGYNNYANANFLVQSGDNQILFVKRKEKPND